MSLMDGRRLVRALFVGGLGFLFFGGAVGFVSAGDAAAAEETWLVPAPGPGDRASYDVEERILDRRQADRSRSLPESRFDVEWMPADEILAGDLTARQAHVLGTTFRYVRSDHETRNEVAFDAATGVPLSRAYEWSGAYEHDVGLVVANPEADGRYEGRRERLEGPLAPCGLRSDLQGRPVAAGDQVVVFGGCEADPDSRATLFTVRGWDELDGDRYLLLESAGGLRLHYDPALPVPVRVEAHMLEQMDPSFAVGRRFTLELSAYHGGGSAYEAVSAGPPGEAP
ncbi:MAG TPA: hypothetical protein VJ874_02475, partial [Candidatus Thermoplasmatota archaeon]|nr:hypothetical protein [Candidatus Thermoplasmatota archaeon]